MLDHDGCSWPFHCHEGCMSCQEFESKHGEEIDRYISNLAEVREAARRERRSKRQSGS